MDVDRLVRDSRNWDGDNDDDDNDDDDDDDDDDDGNRNLTIPGAIGQNPTNDDDVVTEGGVKEGEGHLASHSILGNSLNSYQVATSEAEVVNNKSIFLRK